MTKPAWRSKPTWMAVATKDRTIKPDLEQWYAPRPNCQKVEIEGASHAVYVSRPKEVVRVQLVRLFTNNLQPLYNYSVTT
jgi:pimeloyl-ACP methyl ester carboxylesterase